QRVGRIRRLIAALRQRGLVLGTLALLLPVAMQALPVLLALLGGTQAQLRRCRLHWLDQQVLNEPIHGRCRDTLAEWATVLQVKLVTGVPRRGAQPSVACPHGQTATTTRQAAVEQRRGASTRRPARAAAPVIVTQSLSVLFVLLPRDVGGPSVLEQTDPLLRWCRPPPRLGAPSRLRHRVHWAAAVDVRPCVERVPQDLVQRPTTHRPPPQLALVRALVDAYTEPD